MPSRTTLWRRRKLLKLAAAGHLPPNVASTRGRKTAEERIESLKFVGAVIAQLLEYGIATEAGLKKYPEVIKAERRERVRTAEGAIIFPRALFKNPDGSISQVKGAPEWAMPAPSAWREIEDSPHSPGCLALAAGAVGQLVRLTRPRKSSDLQSTHTDSAPRRESSRHRDLTWKAVPGMTKESAHYWRVRRRGDYRQAVLWLMELLRRHGFESRFDADEAIAQGTQGRRDLSAVLEGRTLRVNRHDAGYSREAPHFNLKQGRHHAERQAAASI